MLECETVINADLQVMLVKKQRMYAWIALVIGLIGMIAYIVLGILFESAWVEILLLFALPFGMGLVFIITINKSLKQNKMNFAMVNCYKFEEESFSVITIKDNENIGESKIYYKDIFKIKEIKGFIFIFVNKFSALPIAISKLNTEQLVELKRLLSKSRCKLNKI